MPLSMQNYLHQKTFPIYIYLSKSGATLTFRATLAGNFHRFEATQIGATFWIAFRHTVLTIKWYTKGRLLL